MAFIVIYISVAISDKLMNLNWGFDNIKGAVFLGLFFIVLYALVKTVAHLTGFHRIEKRSNR